MGSAALRGLGRILKGRVKPKGKSSYPATKPRGKGAYPTKPSEALGIKQPEGIPGTRIADKARPIIPEIKKTTRDIGKGAIIAGVAYAAGKAKAKEKKKKLKEAAEEHREKTKEKREKHGKHHG